MPGLSGGKEKKLAVDQFITELYQKHHRQVKSAVMLYLHSTKIEDIEDCIQEVFLTAAANSEKLKTHPNAAGWLMITAKNKAYTANRIINSNQKHIDSFLEDAAADCSDPNNMEDMVINKIEWDRLKQEQVLEKVFGELAYEEKKLYQLRWRDGLSYNELAERLSISLSNVKVQLHRLKKKITNLVKKYST